MRRIQVAGESAAFPVRDRGPPVAKATSNYLWLGRQQFGRRLQAENKGPLAPQSATDDVSHPPAVAQVSIEGVPSAGTTGGGGVAAPGVPPPVLPARGSGNTKGASLGLVIGASLGGAVLLGIITAAALLVCCRKAASTQHAEHGGCDKRKAGGTESVHDSVSLHSEAEDQHVIAMGLSLIHI